MEKIRAAHAAAAAVAIVLVARENDIVAGDFDGRAGIRLTIN